MGNKELLNRLLDLAAEDGWQIRKYDDRVIFSIYSPCGVRFGFDICTDEYYDTEAEAAEDLLVKIRVAYEIFDVSKEAYKHLDENGHGKDGASYKMIDVYKDVEECQDAILNLYYLLNDYYYEICEED